MRLTLKEIDKMSLNELKENLLKNENHLSILNNLENKNVAFYNREHYETRMNIYNLKLKISEVSK